MVRAVRRQTGHCGSGAFGCNNTSRAWTCRCRSRRGLVKQRVTRSGQGKAGGFRTFYRTNELAFFVYGFAKSDRANIDADEEAAFKKAAAYVLGLSEAYLAQLISKGQFTEVHDNDKKISK